MNVKSVEPVSQKKKPKTESVPPVTENLPEEEIKPSPTPSEAIPEQLVQEEAPQFELFSLESISKDKVELAESFGIPIKGLVEGVNARFSAFASSVEARFNILAEGVDKNPERTIQLLQKEATKAREEYVKTHPQEQQSQQGGPAGLGGLGQLLPLLGPLLGAGTSNPMMEQFMTAAMQNAMESMSYGTAFMRAVFTRMAPELANELAAKTAKVILAATVIP